MRVKISALLAVTGLIFAAVLSAGVWATDERAINNVAKAPAWAPVDKWSWKTDKICSYLNVYPIDVNGTLTINYTEDDQSIKDTVVAVESTKYRISFVETGWLNGTYQFVPSPTGTTNGWVISNGTVKALFEKTGVRYRNVADFSLVNASLTMAYHYGTTRVDGNYRVFNWSGNETHVLQTDNALNSLKFPLTLGASWNVNTNLTDAYTGVKEWPEYPAWGTRNYSGSRYDHYQYGVTVDGALATKNTPAGTFDCFKLSDSGSDDWGWTEGAASSSGSMSYIQDRYWSLIAGVTANTNDTTKLEAYSHSANQKPAISSIGTQTANEEAEFTLALAPFASDPDVINGSGDSLIFNASCSPWITGFTVNETTGTLTVTPQQEHIGAHQITVSVTDWFGEKATGTFILAVTNVNDAPIVVEGIANVTVNENSTLATDTYLNIVFADPDPPAFDSVTYSFSGNGSIGVAVGDDSKVTLTAPDFYAPAAPVALTFTATDNGSGNSSAIRSVSTVMNVTVSHRNHRPVPKNITDIVMEEDIAMVGIDLARYFSDADIAYAGDALSFNFSGNKSISVILTGSQVNLYPAANWTGNETIIFTATDMANATVQITVRIIVLGINDLPVIQTTGTIPANQSTEIPEAVNGTVSEVRFQLNATDIDGDVLNITWTVTDVAGTKVNEGKGISILFKSSFLGNFSSSGSPYKVKAFATDGKENVSREWTITVTDVNRNPVSFINLPKNGTRFEEKKPVSLDSAGTRDDDQALSTLKYEWTSSIQGALGTNATMVLKNLKKGTHVITLKVTDEKGAVATSSVKVTIIAKPGGSGVPGFGALIGALAIGLGAALIIRRKK